MTSTVKETYNEILNSLKLSITYTGVKVDSTGASKIIADADFVVLPQLSDYAIATKPQDEEYLALSKKCKTAAELHKMCEQLNIRSVASKEVPKLVSVELANRCKPVGKKRV